MSYQLPARRARVSRSVAIGDVISDMRSLVTDPKQSSEIRQCLTKANASVSDLASKRHDLNAHWNPTGIYSLHDFEQLYVNTLAMLQAAASVAQRAISEPLSEHARSQIRNELAGVQRKMSIMELPVRGEAQPWFAALRTAKSAGVAYVDAPGFKRWIVYSMLAAEHAVVAAAMHACIRPWWVGALSTFMTVFNKLAAVAKSIAGVTVDFVKAAGKTVLKIPDMIGTVITVAKWGVVAGVAYWIYTGGHKGLLSR